MSGRSVCLQAHGRAAWVTSVFASAVSAQPTITSLGTGPGGASSYAHGVGAAGSVVVGYYNIPGAGRAFRWTAAAGMESLGVLPGGTDSVARGVSADGVVIVGDVLFPGYSRAFRWTAQGGMVDLGVISGGVSPRANASNADGSVVVGHYVASGGMRAFRWTGVGGMQSLGTLPGGGSSTAYGVSADGSVIVGKSSSSAGDRAFRWTSSSGMQGLGTLQGGTASVAWGVSADGSTVVGTNTGPDGDRAFRWTAGGGMQSLGVLPGGGWSDATAVSGDGSIVVGKASNSSGEHRAILWASSIGLVDLNTYLPTLCVDLNGWNLRWATGASDDGTSIVGHGFTPSYHSWVVRGLPTPGSPFPSITHHPTGRAVMAGAAASFSVAASGTGPYGYQWRKDGVSLTNGGAVSGATSSTLVINPVSAAHGGRYSVVVRYGNCATTSWSASLAVVNAVASAAPTSMGAYGGAVAGIPDVNGDGRGDFAVGAVREPGSGGAARAGRVYIYSGATQAVLRTLTSPNPEVDGGFGSSVSGIPDVNGDGRGDIVVGAPNEDPGASPADCGRAYIFSGATGALLRTLQSAGQEAGGHFGWSVAGLADVNGDGRGDVAVGAPDDDPGASPDSCGRVYMYSGATGMYLRALASPMPEWGGRFGWAVASVPDANGDGRGDVVVGAPNEDPGAAPADCGQGYVYSGATGARLWTLASPAPEASGQFGSAVSGVPDLNGDGKGDVVIGSPREDPGSSPTDCGRAHVYSGATGALVRTLQPVAAESGGLFGAAVAGTFDLENDGRGDIAVGAPGEDPGSAPADCGRVHVYSGASGARIISVASPGQMAGGAFGSAAAGVPDTNANHHADLIVGGPREAASGSPAQAGRAYILRF